MFIEPQSRPTLTQSSCITIQNIILIIREKKMFWVNACKKIVFTFFSLFFSTNFYSHLKFFSIIFCLMLWGLIFIDENCCKYPNLKPLTTIDFAFCWNASMNAILLYFVSQTQRQKFLCNWIIGSIDWITNWTIIISNVYESHSCQFSHKVMTYGSRQN